MKYVSIDLETTSLEPHPDHILMFSFVIEDTSKPEVLVEDLPHCTGFIYREKIHGQPYALAMNGWILDILAKRAIGAYPVYKEDEWETSVRFFLDAHFGPSRITAAGKNVAGFDMRFLPPGLQELFRHRVLDIGNHCVNWESDEVVPDLKQCKVRCGIKTAVAHHARDDAMDVIRCFREIKLCATSDEL